MSLIDVDEFKSPLPFFPSLPVEGVGGPSDTGPFYSRVGQTKLDPSKKGGILKINSRGF